MHNNEEVRESSGERDGDDDNKNTNNRHSDVMEHEHGGHREHNTTVSSSSTATNTSSGVNSSKVLFGFTRKQIMSFIALATTIITLISANIGVSLRSSNNLMVAGTTAVRAGALMDTSANNASSVVYIICVFMKELHNLTELEC
jgi:hypothetical protein